MPAAGEWCASCGGPRAGADHRRCALDPPRYCTRCRRRLKVQVFPLEYRAACPWCDRLPEPGAKLGAGTRGQRR